MQLATLPAVLATVIASAIRTRPSGCPTTDVDLWSDDVLRDPYPTARALRDLGPTVWLERYNLVAVPRFADVRAALANWKLYSSAKGVGVDEGVNEGAGANILASDPPVHDQFRRTLSEQLSVSCLGPEVDGLARTATALVDRLLERSSFDAVADLARHYSLTVVCDLLGLPEDQRAPLPHLAERAFNTFGPANKQCVDGLKAVMELWGHALTVGQTGVLEPGSKGADLVARGEADKVMAYTWPGIDTTVNAIASAVYLFATFPDQWDRLRSELSLMPSAFAEVLRLHTPVQYFTRVTTADTDIGGTQIAAGTRVLLMYGSANRDERHYPEPDRFDVGRNPVDQLAFGRGIHLCVGINLAKMEATAILGELARRVERFEITVPPTWLVNNSLHGLASLPVTVRAAV